MRRAAQPRDIAQVVNRFPGFAGYFVELRLRDAKAQQKVVYPSRQRIGAIEHADVIPFRQIKLKKEAVVFEGIAGGRVHFQQRLSQLVTKGQTFVRQVVQQRLP